MNTVSKTFFSRTTSFSVWQLHILFRAPSDPTFSMLQTFRPNLIPEGCSKHRYVFSDSINVSILAICYFLKLKEITNI